MTRDAMLDRIHEMWSAVDPVPDGLVARMQAAAAAEVELAATDLDYELLMLIERSTQLAGTRSASTTYTLRFGADGLDLLVRVAPEADATRLDGWIVPPEPVAVRMERDDGQSWQTSTDSHGRFTLADLPKGLYRLFVEPESPDGRPFGTPTFEI